MIKNMLMLVFVAFALLLAAGCSSPISPEARAALDKPIDCSTAEEDIRILEAEKASVAKQAAQGVTAVTPAGAALGILGGYESDKIEVATGEYNAKIDKKIAEIKQQCNIK